MLAKWLVYWGYACFRTLFRNVNSFNESFGGGNLLEAYKYFKTLDNTRDIYLNN